MCVNHSNASVHVGCEKDAEDLILTFLDAEEIKYYCDPQKTEEVNTFDDLLTYSKDICSRTVLSLVSDKVSNYQIMLRTVQ